MSNQLPSYPLRLPDDIKKRCQQKAKEKRMSLNQWIIQAMEEKADNQ
jgi:predicted HicB family RNase H-like nuclease